MQNTLRIKILLLALLLFSSVGQAATGPETAQLLNQRYQNTPSQCPGDNPAYFCSGVLVFGSDGPAEFWKHSATATQLGAEGFNYLRADLGTRTLPQTYGAVFSDQFTAIGLGKSLDVLCAYPFEFPIPATRPDMGCGWAAAALERAQDVSSCTALGVTDAQGWLAHFAQQGNQAVAQCSLSSQSPTQFKASLIAHQGLDATWSALPMRVQIRNWDEPAPARLSLQALFYDMKQAGSLLGAQKNQRDYFKATGEWLPILRLDLSLAPNGVFGFNKEEQLYTGYEVAARLNARAVDKTENCKGNTASYHCAGVMIRATSVSTGYHSWNPSDQSIKGNGVSFTFVTHGAKITQAYRPQGFIVRESFAPSGKPLTVRCIYPFDAATGNSPDICRTHGDTCDALDVTTSDLWTARYASTPTRSCAFNTDAQNFQLATTVRPFAVDPFGWNELVIEPWTEEHPERLPMEAIAIFSPSYNAGDGLAGARFIQRDYFQVTGRFLPIVRVLFTAAPGSTFSYDVEDQALGDSSTQTLKNAIPFQPESMRDD
ncbi:hypothetical protein [Pseudomonas sp. SDO52101_S400]